jgi:DNA-3-methyladenine glycosylase
MTEMFGNGGTGMEKEEYITGFDSHSNRRRNQAGTRQIMRDFFQQPTLELAKQLLGMEMVHETKEGTVAGRIIEVEAYKGPEDQAAHSFGGRRTKRTEVMYGAPGYAYIYLIYGMHLCLNIVTGPKEKPEAILIRALEPTQGIDLMGKHRNIDVFDRKISKLKTLTNGPGKVSKALNISMQQYGHDLTRSPLYIKFRSSKLQGNNIANGPRINIDYAGEACYYPWRFWIKGNPFVSK